MTPSMMKDLVESLRIDGLHGYAEQVECAAGALERVERERDSARLAAHASGMDLIEMARACGQRDDEYPRKAIERHIADLDAQLAEVRADIDAMNVPVVQHLSWCNGQHDGACDVLKAAECARPAAVASEEVDLDGHVDARGIRYIGKARRQPGGKYHCLANVHGCLCLVEVAIVASPSETRSEASQEGDLPDPDEACPACGHKLNGDWGGMVNAHGRCTVRNHWRDRQAYARLRSAAPAEGVARKTSRLDDHYPPEHRNMPCAMTAFDVVWAQGHAAGRRTGAETEREACVEWVRHAEGDGVADDLVRERAEEEETKDDELAPLRARMAKGRAKYPNGCTAMSLVDEAGEVAHAINKGESFERVRDELLDVAGVAMRLYLGEVDAENVLEGLVQRRNPPAVAASFADITDAETKP